MASAPRSPSSPVSSPCLLSSFPRPPFTAIVKKLVAANYMCVHVDGTITGDKQLSFLSDARTSDISKSITLVGNDRKDGKLNGYVYNVRLLSPSASLNYQLVKEPPVKLALGSCRFDGIEAVGSGGVWGIVGGKIVASLLYADNGTPVDKL